MIYSVWDPAKKLYDYYQTPASASDTDTPIPKHLRFKFKSPVGHGSDVAWPLPSDAMKVGSGIFAKGSIAMAGGGVSMSDVLSGFEIAGVPIVPVAIVVTIGYLLLR